MGFNFSSKFSASNPILIRISHHISASCFHFVRTSFVFDGAPAHHLIVEAILNRSVPRALKLLFREGTSHMLLTTCSRLLSVLHPEQSLPAFSLSIRHIYLPHVLPSCSIEIWFSSSRLALTEIQLNRNLNHSSACRTPPDVVAEVATRNSSLTHRLLVVVDSLLEPLMVLRLVEVPRTILAQLVYLRQLHNLRHRAPGLNQARRQHLHDLHNQDRLHQDLAHQPHQAPLLPQHPS